MLRAELRLMFHLLEATNKKMWQTWYITRTHKPTTHAEDLPGQYRSSNPAMRLFIVIPNHRIFFAQSEDIAWDGMELSAALDRQKRGKGNVLVRNDALCY